MVIQVKLNSVEDDEEVIIFLDNLSHLKSAEDSSGNGYTEVHLANQQIVKVKQNMKECQQAITAALYRR